MPSIWKTVYNKLSEPVVSNRSIDLWAFAGYVCLGWWGTFSVLTGIPSITAAATPLYELMWGAAIAVFAMVAGVASLSTFFRIPRVSRIVKKQTERAALVPLIFFIAVYPAILAAQAISGDTTKIATIGIGAYFLVGTIWRVIHLGCRIKGLRTLGKSDHDG